MDANLALTRLLRARWEVWQQDGLLLLRHATQTLTPQQRQSLTQHKDALLAALDDVLAFEERAAIMEYCGGLARDDAEQVAREGRETRATLAAVMNGERRGTTQRYDDCTQEHGRRERTRFPLAEQEELKDVEYHRPRGHRRTGAPGTV